MGRINDERRAQILAENHNATFIVLDASTDEDDAAGEPAADVTAGEAVMELAFRRGSLANWKQYQQALRKGFAGQADGSVGIEPTLYAQGLLIEPSAQGEEWKNLRENAPDVCNDIGHKLLKVHSAGLKVRLGKP